MAGMWIEPKNLFYTATERDHYPLFLKVPYPQKYNTNQTCFFV